MKVMRVQQDLKEQQGQQDLEKLVPPEFKDRLDKQELEVQLV
jgi:hypothetical protein